MISSLAPSISIDPTKAARASTDKKNDTPTSTDSVTTTIQATSPTHTIVSVGDNIKKAADSEWRTQWTQRRRLHNRVEIFRINGFADNVFAFAITLAVTNLDIPPVGTVHGVALQNAILANWPVFLGILLINLILVILYSDHIYTHAVYEGVDNTIATFCMAYLVGIAFIPLTFQFIIEWASNYVTPMIIGINLLYISVLQLAIWLYATINRKFIKHNKITDDTIRIRTITMVLQVIVFVATILLSLASPYASYGLLGAFVLFHMISSIPRLDIVPRVYFMLKWIITHVIETRKEQPSASFMASLPEEFSSPNENIGALPPMEFPDVVNIEDTDDEITVPNLSPHGRSSTIGEIFVSEGSGRNLERVKKAGAVPVKIVKHVKKTDEIVGGKIKEDRKKQTNSEFHSRIMERIESIGDDTFAAVLTVLIIQLNPPVASYFKTVAATNSTMCNSTIINSTVINANLTSNCTSTNSTTVAYTMTELNAQLWSKVLGQYPLFLINLLAFVLVGTFWKTHMYMHRGVVKSNKTLTLCNFLFVSFVIFLPFSINLLGAFQEVQASVVLAGNVLLIVMAYTLTHMVTLLMKLKEEQYRMKHLSYPTIIRCFVELGVALVAFLVSFFSVYATIALILVLPLFEILASLRLDIFFWGWRLTHYIMYEIRTQAKT